MSSPNTYIFVSTPLLLRLIVFLIMALALNIFVERVGFEPT